MRYLCLAYYDEQKFEALPKAELDAIVIQCAARDEALRSTGKLVIVGSLGSPRSSRAIRPRKGHASITDGPYLETKEQVGAFFILEAADLDDALAVASLHPAATLGEKIGWGIEVRPIEGFMQP